MALNRVRLVNGKFYTDAENPLGIPVPDKYVSSRPHFIDTRDMTDAMRDPRYQTDEGYRQHVAQMIDASDPVAIGLEARGYQDEGDKVEAVHDWVRQAFSNPLYKTSALYRSQLAEAIRNDATIDDVFVSPLHPSFTPGLGGVQRFQVEPDITGPNAPAPKPRYNSENVSNSVDAKQE